ncbi:bile acid:sodium symporter family protein [Aliihoeflea aestuarii]|uniref:bile acid:sodium symporter family protein n=1 Tax=Aliihoeflea aestuarii TaxID=453840 RepID=UPI0020937616|nr:bile acid:sodium symporter [Aliihoeflea aestuarii]MCO6389721.1 bile acid:sodium symporter family protein [Aliihoeflea aestuarii]
MDSLITIFLPLALGTIMLSLGLVLTLADFRRVLTKPKAFVIGVSCQLLLIPVVAYVLIATFGFSGELALGIMILSFCPGGPSSNILTKLARGDLALAIAMTGATSLIAVVTVPLLVAFSAEHFMGLDAPRIDVRALGLTMFAITAVPVAIGMTIRGLAPGVAARIEPVLDRLALVLFVVIVVGAIAANWSLLTANLALLGPLLVVLNVILLFAGLGLAHLFRLPQEQATAISIEAGIQNATLGIAIGSLIVERVMALPPFSLPSGLYGVTMYAVSIPFVLWRRRLAG